MQKNINILQDSTDSKCWLSNSEKQLYHLNIRRLLVLKNVLDSAEWK